MLKALCFTSLNTAYKTKVYLVPGDREETVCLKTDSSAVTVSGVSVPLLYLNMYVKLFTLLHSKVSWVSVRAFIKTPLMLGEAAEGDHFISFHILNYNQHIK